MLNVVSFTLNIIDQYGIWLYVACLLGILYYARSFGLARKEQANTVFTIEKEVAAHKGGRALSGIGSMLGIMVVITALRYYVVPLVNLDALAQPTSTLDLVGPTRRLLTETPLEPTPRPPTATPRPRPTRPLINTQSPPTPTPVPTASCPDPNVRITWPGMNAQISGRTAIHGTAQLDRFQFYKVECGQGEEPTAWHVIHDVHRMEVVDGVLEEFNTTTLPNGVYWLQLTVVDQTGNFPPPCQVRVIIQN